MKLQQALMVKDDIVTFVCIPVSAMLAYQNMGWCVVLVPESESAES